MTASAQSSSFAAGREQRVWLAAGLNLLAMLAELEGAVRFSSAALMAEGLHMGAHVAAVLIAGLGYRLSDRARSHGQAAFARRIDAGAALLNAAILVLIAGALLVESLGHLKTEPRIAVGQALVLAVAGLIVTFVSLRLLGHGADGPAPDLNLRAITLHMLSDAAVGVLSILGLGFVALFHWRWADGAAGVCGAALILAFAGQIALAALAGRGRSV